MGLIADGGMSSVWKARQQSLNRLVALKILKTDLVQNEDDIERFRTEAQAAAQVLHPGLCQIFDAGNENGLVYYAMEYVAGFSVGQLLLQKGRLSERQALTIARGAASVLNDISKKYRIIHCDIKPANLLIDQDGEVRVADLGISRVIGNMAHNADADYYVGTPNYNSPEQASGLDTLDSRTDIYALGATLYHMLTGVIPFCDAEDEAAIDQHVIGFLPDLQTIEPSISDGAAMLVEKLMIKDRDARYADWEGVLHDIDEVREGRLPAGKLVEVRKSTMLRTAQRETSTLRTQEATKTSAQASSSAPLRRSVPGTASKRKVLKRVSGTVPAASIPRSTRSRAVTFPKPSNGIKVHRPGISESLARTIFLAFLVGGLYGGTFYFMAYSPESSAGPDLNRTDPAARVTKSPPDGSDIHSVPDPDPDPKPAPRPSTHESRNAQPEFQDPHTALRPELRPTPASEPAPPVHDEPRVRAEPPSDSQPPEPREEASSHNEPWDHPDYVRAMRLLREVDARFQRFLRGRDQELLTDLEPACREAIRLLESVADEAPRRARIEQRIRQAYQLIANLRRSTL